MITIDRRLNLVIPIIRDDDTKLYIHSTPIRPETFEQYHLVLAKTFSSFAQNGLDPRSGPSVAAMILKDVAQATMRAPGLDWWSGSNGIGGEGGLLAEIIRLSNAVVSTTDKGWSTVPLRTALDQKLIDEDEHREAENLLVFFTVVSVVAPRVDRPRLVRGMAAIYELQTTLLNCSEYAASLKTSTPAETTGEKPPA
jgi:hypothetical protein